MFVIYLQSFKFYKYWFNELCIYTIQLSNVAVLDARASKNYTWGVFIT